MTVFLWLFVIGVVVGPLLRLFEKDLGVLEVLLVCVAGVVCVYFFG